MTTFFRRRRGAQRVGLSLLALSGCESDPAPQAQAVAPAPAPAPAAMLIPLCVNDRCAVLDQNGLWSLANHRIKPARMRA